MPGTDTRDVSAFLSSETPNFLARDVLSMLRHHIWQVALASSFIIVGLRALRQEILSRRTLGGFEAKFSLTLQLGLRKRTRVRHEPVPRKRWRISDTPRKRPVRARKGA